MTPTSPPSGFLDRETRVAIEALAQAYPAVAKLLDAYTVEHARLTLTGEDMTSVDGGYSCCTVSDRDFDGGRVVVRRTNVRQAIDALMAYYEAEHGPRRDDARPWWVRVADRTDNEPGAEWNRPDAPDHPDINPWVGPAKQTPGEAAQEEASWVDDRIKGLIDDLQMYREVDRIQSGKIARLMVAMGASTEEVFSDSDVWLYRNHPDKLRPEARDRIAAMIARMEAEEGEQS